MAIGPLVSRMASSGALKDVDKTKPLDLYFGPKAPKGRENRWIKTPAGKGWFAYIRIYGPEPAAFDKSWKPGDILLAK